MQLKTLGIVDKTKMRRLKGPKKKANQIGTMRLKEQHGGEFPGFFCLTCCRLEAEDAGNPETPISKDTKLKRRLLSLCKGPGKGQNTKTEKFQTLNIIL